MKCFSMQKLKKRHNGAAEHAGSLEENAGADVEEVSSPSVASSVSLPTRLSFRSRVRAIQNAQRFINSNPKLRSSHPSYGSREPKKDAPDASSPLLPLGGRARSTTEHSLVSFVDAATLAASRGSRHAESASAGTSSAALAPFPQPLPSPPQGLSQCLQKASQPCNVYRLPLPSQNAHSASSRPISPLLNSPKSGALDTTCMGTTMPLPPLSKHSGLLLSSSPPSIATSSLCNHKQDGTNLTSHAQRESAQSVCKGVPSMVNRVINASCSILELQPLPPPDRDTLVTSPLRCFTYDELISACQKFSREHRNDEDDANMCFNASIKAKGNGKGGKHQDVMVLILREPQQQGFREWISKLLMVANELQQPLPHVCKLLGVYAEEGCVERMLVYERLKRGTLSSLLFEAAETGPLDWGLRMKIAYGAAEGLATLHEKFPNLVLYEDFRASYIQVDHDHSSKVSLYRLVNSSNVEIQSTLNKSRVLQVNASRVPEWQSRGKLTLKSNVWSFGIILLELLSGKQHIDKGMARNESLNLVKWAHPFLINEGMLFLLMDPKLRGKFPSRGAKKVADLALACIHKDPTKRPTMREALDIVRDVHESRYATRCSGGKETMIVSSSALPASGPMSGSLSSVMTSPQRSSMRKSPSKFDVINNPPLRPLVIPPRCGGEGVVHHQHDYSPAPLAHVRF